MSIYSKTRLRYSRERVLRSSEGIPLLEVTIPGFLIFSPGSVLPAAALPRPPEVSTLSTYGEFAE